MVPGDNEEEQGKTLLSTNMLRNLDGHTSKMKQEPYLIPFTKVNSNGLVTLGFDLIPENTLAKHQDMDFRNIFN